MMAIKGGYVFDGISVADCYGRFEFFNGRHKVDYVAMLSLYASPEYAATSGATSFTAIPIAFSYDPHATASVNAQAYAAAKLDPRFANWSDC